MSYLEAFSIKPETAVGVLRGSGWLGHEGGWLGGYERMGRRKIGEERTRYTMGSRIGVRSREGEEARVDDLEFD